jgi:hypothetical protein
VSDVSSVASKQPAKNKVARSRKKIAKSESDFEVSADESSSSDSSVLEGSVSDVKIEDSDNEDIAVYSHSRIVRINWKPTERMSTLPVHILSLSNEEILEDFRSCIPEESSEQSRFKQDLSAAGSPNLVLQLLYDRGSSIVSIYLKSSWRGFKPEIVRDYLSRLQHAASDFVRTLK